VRQANLRHLQELIAPESMTWSPTIKGVEGAARFVLLFLTGQRIKRIYE
jgi:hypothetical protein